MTDSVQTVVADVKADAAVVKADVVTWWTRLKAWFATNWVHIAGYGSIVAVLKKFI